MNKMTSWRPGIIIALCFSMSTFAAIVNRYSFTGDSVTSAIDSVGGKNGTLAGNAVISGNKLVLDGSSWVSLPSDVLSNYTSASIEIWFTLTESNGWVRVFDFGDSSGSGGSYYWFYSPSGSSTSRLVISTVSGEQVASTTMLSAGITYHIVCVYDAAASQMRLYQNGSLVASTSVTSLLSDVHRVNAYIGKSNYTWDPSLKGSIDEFRIHDTAMTAVEIQNSYTKGPDSLQNDLINVQQTDGTTLVEEGATTDSILISLKQQPTASVQIKVTPQTSDLELNGSFAGDPATLTFTPGNWAAAQTVHIVAVQDNIEEGDETVGLQFAVTSSDPNYNANIVAPLNVTVVDYKVNPCPLGDIDGDCQVTLADLEILAQQWLNAPGCSGLNCGDLVNHDGVNLGDLAVLSQSWLDEFGPVVINEFMAKNASTDPSGFDETGKAVDWIELYNVSSQTVSMNGWYLTNDPNNPTQWAFPSTVTIAPKSFLMVYATGEDMVSGSYIHTNFSLNDAGEYLALIAPGGKIATEYKDVKGGFPPQDVNISYGLFGYFKEHRYFYPATPGQANKNSAVGIAPDTKFSVKRGFFTAPFDVTITTDDSTATIYYTLDGSNPTLDNGTVFDSANPIHISKTTTLRAASFKTGWLPSNIDTQTYIFVADVITQSPNGELPGPGWPANYAVNNCRMDYGMDPDVVNSTDYSGLVDDALLAIPTLSLVTDLKNLFDPTYGIYTTATMSGDAVERPCSLELIYPDGTAGFQIDCGMRLRGGASQNTGNPKHALRFLFKTQYGNSKLNYPLFGDEGVDQFDNVDLRTAANYAWSYFNDVNNYHNTFVRDEYSRLVQGMMGYPYTRGRYYHLYMNGQYWGLYQTEERPDARYASSYLGGSKDDYDVVKADVVGWDRPVVASDGNLVAYRRLYDAIKDGVGTIAEYFSLQGMNTDGTRNPAYERLLDVDDLMDYMLIEYYTCDFDGPGSRFVVTNNFIGIYNRVNPDGWKWFQHDSEHSFGVYEKDDTNRENMVTPFSTAGSSFTYFNPFWLHEQLANNNAEYRLHFADRAQEQFFNGGLLSADKVWQTITGLSTQIDSAIIAESARWGDANANPARTKATWLEALQFLNNYIYGTSSVLSDSTANAHENWPMELREIRVRDQFRSVGWFPSIDAPQYSQHGGNVAAGYSLTITNPNASGTTYYTTDGTDPRTAPTETETADVVLVAENAAKQVKIPTANIYAADSSVRAETWTGITGSAVTDLTGNANYPNSPSKVEYWNIFQMPTINWGDNYGTRVSALIYPPTTGSYRFWISSDDTSQLSLSTDSTAANASVIATVPSYTNYNTWTTYSSQRSAARTLTAGTPYYIEAIQKESNGGDHVSVAWSGPGITGPVVIAGQYLSIPENVWAGINYTPTGWTSGSGAVGYERNPGDTLNYSSYINSGINVSQMYNVNTTCYIRIPFQYSGQILTQLILKMRYDDGFVAFLNGKEIARDNVSTTSALAWNTGAAGDRPDATAVTVVSFDISQYISQLQNGTNVLAIQGLNNGKTSSDFLITAELIGKTNSVGNPSAGAVAYTAPITLNKSTQVKSRVYSGTEWSALCKANFAVGPVKESLRVTELMYHPAEPNLAFVELQNIGTGAINLNLVQFNKGLTYTFGDLSVASGGFVLLVKNIAEFQAHYTSLPAGVPVIQWTDGQLSNSGETIQLVDAAGGVIGSFKYEDWYSQTDGEGFSLVKLNPSTAALTDWSLKTGWAPSTYSGGSPGVAETPLAAGSIVINEILAHSHDTLPDWIEFRNTTSSAISIGGWYLSDSASNVQMYQIPAGKVVPANGYLVLYENTDFGSAFKLSENGETLYVNGAIGGVLTGYTLEQAFGASETGVSFGRYQKSTGGIDFVLMSSTTPGAANSYPLVGPVVINEIMYNPKINSDAEYVELMNISSQPVNLWYYDPSTSETLSWRFVDSDESILLTIPANTTLAAGEKMLLIKNLAAFQSEYGSIPSGVKYAVWPAGSLSNGGEKIELQKPGDTDIAGVRYYIRVDRVNYSDGSHPVGDDLWPTSPDGTGTSLHRVTPANYGNDVANWTAATPSPGN